MKLKYFIPGMILMLVAVVAVADEFKEKKVIAAVDADGIQRVEMTGGEYFYDPNVVVVKVNVPVELKVKKAGGIAPHDIVLKAPEAGIDFSEQLTSASKIIKFTPTKTGKYDFVCSERFLFFKSHKDRGMHGTLEVVE